MSKNGYPASSNAELDDYEHLGRLIRRAKLRAYEKMEAVKPTFGQVDV